MKTFGIDISEWQKGFNFDKAEKEGVQFAILRGAYHLDKDACFEDFYKACVSRDIGVGVYHYSMAKTVAEAKEEAAFFIRNVLKGKQFDYPVFLDVEDKTQKKLGKKLLTDIIVAYCEELEKAGYYVGIYSTASFLKSYTTESRLAPYDKWIAQWNTECEYAGSYGMWQFGGETNYLRSNKVAGVVCDQDYAYKDYPAIIKSAGLNGYGKTQGKKEEAPAARKKTVDELAREVIAGKWGSGAERKQKLTAAGYNADAVQKRVNELLTGSKPVQPAKSIDAVAKEVIAGKWGSGDTRKRRLTAAGYDYNAVQKRVNELLRS